MTSRELVLGTRGSALALAQTAIVREALAAAHPGLATRVEIIATAGDVRPDVPLAQLGRGMFVSEIETALREGRIDAAVHSAKDMPSTTDQDLRIAAFLPRADARDVLVSRRGPLRALPPGSRVGTSSPRRACLVSAARPDVETVEIRGNVDTRLRKLAEGQFDAILLAAAGLQRLGRLQEATEWLDPDFMIPCVGQGVIAVETRAGDTDALALLAAVDDAETRSAVLAERAFLAELGAGCRAAAAAHARLSGDELHLRAMIGGAAGRYVRGTRQGKRRDAWQLGVELARELLLAGGAGFLAEHGSALQGKRVAITRAEEQADALSALLQARGALPVPCPTISVQPLEDTAALDAVLCQLSRATWLVFTSMNAVAAAKDRLDALGLKLAPGVRIAAVGSATAAEAARLLGRTDFIPSRATAEQLGAELPVRVGDLVVFPRASIASKTLITLLTRRGAVVRDAVAYRTLPGPGARTLARLVRDGRLDAIVFTSPSSVRYANGIGQAMLDAGPDAPRVVCMGPSTARVATELGFPGVLPPTQALGALVETLEQVFSGSADARQR